MLVKPILALLVSVTALGSWNVAPSQAAGSVADIALSAVPPPATNASPQALGPDEPGTVLKGAIDVQVLRAISEAGWQPTEIESVLDPDAIVDSSPQTGSGQWRIMVQDASGATFQLVGQVAFTVSASSLVGLGAGRNDVQFNSQVQAALASDALAARNAELQIASDRSVRQEALTTTDRTTDTVEVTQDGVTSTVQVVRSLESIATSWDVTRTVEHVTIDRDGETHVVDRTTLIHVRGHHESEVWQRIDVDPTAGAAAAQLRFHAFQRADDGIAESWVDQFDYSIAGLTAHLAAPGPVTLRTDGTYDVGLAFETPEGPLEVARIAFDSDGRSAISTERRSAVYQSIRPTTPPDISDPGLSKNGCAIANAITSAIIGAAIGIALSYAAAPLILGSVEAEITLAAVRTSVWADGGTANVVVGIVQSLITSAFKAHFEGNERLQSAIDTTSNLELIALAIYSAGTKGMGVGAVLAGITGVLGWMSGGLGDALALKCNGDPFFTRPDTRTSPTAEAADFEGLVGATGGRLLPDENLNVPGFIGSSPGVPASSAVTFQDAVPPFLAGAAPEGATVLGPWSTDPSRSLDLVASHVEPAGPGLHRHAFIHAPEPLTLGGDDNIIQYVWLDPEDPPGELLLQFYTGDGDGEHRAFWGVDRIQTGGKPGGTALFPMGPIPPAGGWVRLKIEAAAVGLAGATLNGVLYGSWNGHVWWGPTTHSSRSADPAPGQMIVPPTPPAATTEPGADIAFELGSDASVTLTIRNRQGAVVRSLLNAANLASGYHVVSWDATGDDGTAVPDEPYTAVLSIAGRASSGGELAVTISPFIARIDAPGPEGVARGNTVPVVGSAYGDHFAGYLLEVGLGRTPTEWTTIARNTAPVRRPISDRLTPTQVLGLWDAGLDEIRPYADPHPQGLYTLRLTVTGDDGREAVEQLPVYVGAIAHSAVGGIIRSPDGRATLTIPPLATMESFSLLALEPVSESSPAFDVASVLAPGLQVAGDAWEILPPDEAFRNPGALTLPTTVGAQASVAILVGDGTLAGWRTLPSAGAGDGLSITASVLDVGPGRAIFVPVTGTPLPAPAASIEPSLIAPDTSTPTVASVGDARQLNVDFQGTVGEVAPLDWRGTVLSLVQGETAGLRSGDAALRVERGAVGARVLRLTATPYDAAANPLLVFDYRLDPGYAPDVLIQANKNVWVLRTGDGLPVGSKYVAAVPSDPLIADGEWHHAQIDVYGALREADPTATSYRVTSIVLAQLTQSAYMQVFPSDSGPPGSAYELDNVAILRPAARGSAQVAVGADSGIDHWLASVDRDASVARPASSAQGSLQPPAEIALPPGAEDGTWYVHVWGHRATGWGAPATYPMVIDRTPPAAGSRQPSDGGAGDPNDVRVAISDAGGIDLGLLEASFNGASTTYGHGLSYIAILGSAVIHRTLFDELPAAVPPGATVEVVLRSLSDYAGNTAPDVAWQFLVDDRLAAMDPFHQLTSSGGSAPTISPDGSRLAFVAGRNGTERIYAMSTSDSLEAAGTVLALVPGSDRQWDPAWSPDGTQIAYCSDAGGSERVWIAAADGTDAHALTPGGGTVASPSWTPEGDAIAYIGEGNARLIDLDGGTVSALTSASDKPYSRLSWQPDGTMVALQFALYEDRIELLDTMTGEIRRVTDGGSERDPVWYDPATILYTAPAPSGGLDAVWRISVDGSGAAPIEGSAREGSSDSEAATAPEGGALSIVSTRGGTREIWLRRDLTIANFEVLPRAGALPGQPVDLRWSMPAQGSVSLDIEDAAGQVIRSLHSASATGAGPAAATWNGTDDQGITLSPGTYIARLSVTFAGITDALVRLASVHVLDPRGTGFLGVSVQAWPGHSANTLNPQIDVFPAGVRGVPPVASLRGDHATVALPATTYDIEVRVGGVLRATEAGIAVPAGGSLDTTVDLGYGGLDVSVFAGPGHNAGAGTVIEVHRRGEPGSTAATAIGAHASLALPAGIYDLVASDRGASATASPVTIIAGETTRQLIDIGTIGASAGVAITVRGTDVIYLAGRNDIVLPPSDPIAYPIGACGLPFADTRPAQVRVTSGSEISILATGLVNFFGDPPDKPPDGAGSDIIGLIGSLEGISSYIGPQGSLVGVFLADEDPVGQTPPDQIPYNLGGTDALRSAPEIGQVFFVGDGLTGAGTGQRQRIMVPAGATRLFLGFADGTFFFGPPGCYSDNFGEFEVSVEGVGVSRSP